MKNNNLLSIKKFAEFTGLTQSTLRYYDEIGLLPSVQRGNNNYRYYLPYQIITLSFIRVLADLGVPLTTIKELTKNRTPESILELLTQQEKEMEQQLHKLQSSFSIIHTISHNIQTGLDAKNNQISVEYLDDANIILGNINVFDDDGIWYTPFMEFCNSAAELRMDLNYPIGGMHRDLEAFLKAPGQPDRFFSLDPKGNNRRKAGRYLVMYHQSYYGRFDGVPEKIVSYGKTHNLTFSGPLYVIYLLDEISTIDPNNYLAQIMVSLKDE